MAQPAALQAEAELLLDSVTSLLVRDWASPGGPLPRLAEEPGEAGESALPFLSGSSAWRQSIGHALDDAGEHAVQAAQRQLAEREEAVASLRGQLERIRIHTAGVVLKEAAAQRSTAELSAAGTAERAAILESGFLAVQLLRARHTCQARALGAWRALAALAASRRLRTGALLQQRSRSRVASGVYWAWRALAARTQTAERLASAVAARLQGHRLRHALAAWAQAARTRARLCASVQSRCRHRRLRDAVRRWGWAARRRATIRACGARAAGRSAGWRTRGVMRRWSELAVAGQARVAATEKRTAALAALLFHHLQGLLRRSFSAWRAAVAVARAHAASAAALRRRRGAHARRAVLCAWAAVAAEQCALWALLQRSLAATADRRVLAAFRHWHAEALHRRANAAQLGRFASRHAHRRRLAVFKAWRFAAQQHGLKGRSTLARVLARFRNRAVASAFSTWQAAYERALEQAAFDTQLVGHAQRLWRRARKTAAFTFWAAYCRRRAGRAARLVTLHARLQTRHLRVALRSWAGQAAAAAAAGRWQTAAAARHRSQRSAALQRIVLSSWADRGARQRRRKAALQRHTNRRAARCLRCWLAVAARQRGVRLSVSARHARQRAGFVAWRAACFAHRTARSLALRRVRLARLGLLLRTWAGLVSRAKTSRSRAAAMDRAHLRAAARAVLSFWRRNAALSRAAQVEGRSLLAVNAAAAEAAAEAARHEVSQYELKAAKAALGAREADLEAYEQMRVEWEAGAGARARYAAYRFDAPAVADPDHANCKRKNCPACVALRKAKGERSSAGSPGPLRLPPRLARLTDLGSDAGGPARRL